VNEPTPPKVTPRTDAVLVIMTTLCFVIFGSETLFNHVFATVGGLFGVAIRYAVTFTWYRVFMRIYRGKHPELQQ
jgi:hypothetical protein